MPKKMNVNSIASSKQKTHCQEQLKFPRERKYVKRASLDGLSYILATKGVIHRVAAPGSVFEMQNSRSPFWNY